MRKYIYITLVVLLSACAEKSSEKVMYHRIDYTASSIVLEEFNIDSINGISHVKELVDSLGRTKRLEFRNSRGELAYTGSAFYGGPILKYHYPNQKIVETAYASEEELANDFMESEVPNQIIYHLNDKNEIEKTILKYKVDFSMDSIQVKKIIENLELYKSLIPETGMENYLMDSVFGYQFAKAKLNGVNPKSISSKD